VFPAAFQGKTHAVKTAVADRQLLVMPRMEPEVIIIGIILLIIGFLTKIAIVWTLGIIALVVGLILMLLGAVGHAVGPRRHYW
jgi:membrane-bound ClpP family serine protease